MYRRSYTGAVLPRLVGLALLCFWAAPSYSQESLPEAIVLALNVLSETHARPTTGVVVTSSGQILVPAGFVGRGDRIVILAGGNSLDADAVETRTEARSIELGLAVLVAPDLVRRPISVAQSMPHQGERLSFVAFPPAEQLAAGAPPLRESLGVDRTSGMTGLSANTPAPNVNGALIDRCGNLAGLVLATDGSEGQTGPNILWPDDLKDALQTLGVSAEFRSCGTRVAVTGATDSANTPTTGGPEILDSASLQPKAPDLEIRSSRMGGGEQAADPATASEGPIESRSGEAPAANPAPGPAGDTGALPDPVPVLPTTQADTPPAAGPTRWHGSLLALVLIVSALAGWGFGRVSRRPEMAESTVIPGQQETTTSGASATAEETAEFLALAFEASLGDGRRHDLNCRLHREHGSILLGQGQVDLIVPDASLSRVHGRIQWVDGLLTYSDAGSKDGSWIDGIQCLEGERFAIREGSQLILGSVPIVLTSTRPQLSAGS